MKMNSTVKENAAKSSSLMKKLNTNCSESEEQSQSGDGGSRKQSISMDGYKCQSKLQLQSVKATKATVNGSRRNSFEEQPIDPESRYECPICINWLNEPVLTSCGHRFCKSCLNDWLRNKRRWCPIDNEEITGDQDIFPDNYTRREIEQIKLKCPNAKMGCDLIASPIEVERHRYNCPHRLAEEIETEERCPFSVIKCDFVGRSSTNALETHLKDDIALHLQLILKFMQEIAVITWSPYKPPSAVVQMNGDNGIDDKEQLQTGQFANCSGEQLIEALYQRIVVLEQRVREQDVKIENLNKQIANCSLQINPRYSNGTILWEINKFSKLIEHLKSQANHLHYSPECYTSPYGYKFCARLNVPPKSPHMLSLHVHLMQSENDHHLDWPFNGRIKLCMIHPNNSKLSQYDTVMTKPEILAFHKPMERISTRGFGFIDYANIADIVRKGFCDNDRLLIKIQINIV